MDNVKGGQVENKLWIDTGPLSGFGSLAFNVQDELKEFTRSYAKGEDPNVVWDLSSVDVTGWSGIAALAALLSTMERMRQFTNRPPELYIDWKPKVFAFWEDIGFLDKIRKLDLLRIPDKILGGYSHKTGKTNPNTKILYYPSILNGGYPVYGSKKERSNWKDKTREILYNKLYKDCAPLFERRGARKEVRSDLKKTVSLTAAEMVLNSLIHGRTSAFVAVQRTSARISVAVCDSGKGFSRSMHENLGMGKSSRIPSEKQAIIFGSFLRPDHVGLWDAIDEVTDRGGWVIISSIDSEVHWHSPLWIKAKEKFLKESPEKPNKIRVKSYIGEECNSYVPWEEYKNGIHRSYKNGIRGSRVTIEIPIR